MRKKYRNKRTAATALALSFILMLAGCGGTGEEDGVNLDFLVSPDETYEKESASSSDYELADKASLYEEEDDSVITMYLTVGMGNEADGTNHTWSEVNQYPLSYYEENGLTEPYKCEAVLQVGDDNGPIRDEFGYGVTAPNATVRLRGEGASAQEQKSYRIQIKDGKGKWNDQKVIALNKYVADPLRITTKLAYSLMEDIPDMVSARTRLVHLYVKDRTEGEDGLFRDYGLYTQVEQINKTYLKNHGFDSGGQLYKAEEFDWLRHEDSIMTATSEGFDTAGFEQYLEIQEGDDHSGLVKLLEAVNDDSLDIADVVEDYFDEDNLYYWLAFHMLIGNKEAAYGNYYLYSPQVSDKWFFISGNSSDAFSENYNKLRQADYDPSWNTGIFTYTGVKLFERIFQNQECRSRFDGAVTDLFDNHLTADIIAEKAEILKEAAMPYIFSLPDALHERVTSEDYESLIDGLGEEVARNYQLYQESLNQPWPFHILEPQVRGDKLRLCWEEAWLYQEPDAEKTEVSYTVELSDSYSFEDCIADETDVTDTFLDVGMLSPGQYFMRIRAASSSGYEQDAYEYYLTEHGTTIYSTQCFYIHEDGSVELSLYYEDE